MRFFVAICVAPLLAQQSVNFSAVAKERALGQRLATEIRTKFKPLANPAVDTYIRRIGSELVGQLREAPFEYQFEVISGSSRTEPFSLPGGYVLIPANAFAVAQDEAEFVGMLAHSIGHVALRQGMPKSVANIPMVFMGGGTGLHAEGNHPQTSVPVGFLDFQRAHELDADRFGLELSARAGYDASAFQRYVERTHPADSKLSALPARELRLSRIRGIIATLSPAITISQSGEEFRSIQEALRLTMKSPAPLVPTLRR